MTRFAVEKIADYFRVLRINPQGGRKIVSTHRTEKSARKAMLKLSQTERSARIKRTVLCFEGEEYELKPVHAPRKQKPSPQQAYRDYVEGTATEPGAEV